jgi:hypothetical protein
VTRRCPANAATRRRRAGASHALAVLGTILVARAAAGQSSFCFRGRALPKCGAFALFELTGTARLVGTSHIDRTSLTPNFQFPVEDLPSYLSWGLGAMVNRDSAHAIGGTLELGVSEPGWRFAIKARRRTWDRQGGSLDFTAGGLVAQERAANGARQRSYGITAGSAAGLGDVLALTLDADVVRTSSERPRAAVHGGIRLGSYAAIGATTLLLVGIVTIGVRLSQNDF